MRQISVTLYGVQTLEGQLAQERIEIEHLKTLLQRAREKTDEDKESLKKATRFVRRVLVCALLCVRRVWPNQV